MSYALAQSGTQAVLTFDGDLTLRNAEEIRMTLIKALIDADEVAMKFAGVSAVDLSCIQLLCSAHRTAVKLNKRLAFSGTVPDALKQAMDDAGYSRVSGCRLDCNKSCLWAAVTGASHE